MGRSEGTDRDEASSTVASSSLSSGVPRDNGGVGGRGAVRARGTRAGGAGREDSQGLVIRGGAGGARRGEVVVGAITTKMATCESCGRNDASVDEELLAGFGVSVCRACKVRGHEVIEQRSVVGGR